MKNNSNEHDIKRLFTGQALQKKWVDNIRDLHGCLNKLLVWGANQEELSSDEAFYTWMEMTVQLRNECRVVYLIGNGASASMASHLAADLAKNGRLHTQVFTDIALITALANDFSYEEVFAEPLRNRMVAGDMLVAISSSGNSPNIVSAVKIAKGRGGKVVTLSAMSADNAIRKIGDLNFYLPARTYGMAETGHAALLHYWMDGVAGTLS